MPILRVRDLDLFYEERGQGEPLVFLNGLSGDQQYWNGQMRYFGKRYRCLALDNRDVGRSSYATEPYDIKELARDVAGWLQGLAVPPAHLVGLSMGGMIAQELALTAPHLVRSLVLSDTLGRSDQWFRDTLDAFRTVRLHVADTPAFFATILPWWVSHRFYDSAERPTWLRWLLTQNPHPQRLDGFLRQIIALGGHDALDRLAGIRCPVLILVGDDDRISPPRYSHEMQSRLPQARMVVLSGVGHGPPLEDPKQFNAEVERFLREVDGKA
jgi:pimeloyl-ACP methyl ester carboxylesterase